MTDLRALTAEGIDGNADAAGPAPMLQWIEIALLRVDDGYQRPISRAGLKTIRAIAGGFRWAKFSPVVVAPAEGGLFVIIDGQHRTTAALACGIKAVPCQVVPIGRQEQAQAFRDINSQVTAMHSMALHRAAAHAGDELAMRIDAVAARAGVRILKYPVPVLQQLPGQTMAIGAIRRLILNGGDDYAAIVLQFIVKMGGDKPGMLIAPIIQGVGEVFLGAVRKGGGALGVTIDALARVNLLREYGKAQGDARDRAIPVARALVARLLPHANGAR